MMMFADIIKYVEEKEYQLAVDALTPLLKNEDEKIVAKAHHILGYINTRHDYTEKSDYQAKRHLRFNLNSNYPHPYGYDVSAVSKGKTNHPVSEMSLNELLYIADIENILDKNGYHLGHYIRDYRNVVHPAKEIRMSEEVNHENVITMWAVLKRLVSDLYT